MDDINKSRHLYVKHLSQDYWTSRSKKPVRACTRLCNWKTNNHLLLLTLIYLQPSLQGKPEETDESKAEWKKREHIPNLEHCFISPHWLTVMFNCTHYTVEHNSDFSSFTEDFSYCWMCFAFFYWTVAILAYLTSICVSASSHHKQYILSVSLFKVNDSFEHHLFLVCHTRLCFLCSFSLKDLWTVSRWPWISAMPGSLW